MKYIVLATIGIAIYLLAHTLLISKPTKITLQEVLIRIKNFGGYLHWLVGVIAAILVTFVALRLAVHLWNIYR